MTTINPYEEARLYTTNAERERWENMATLFSLIVTLEYLERAYVREGVSEAEYTPACTRLLAQYKTIVKLVTEQSGASSSGPTPVSDVGDFMRRYKMDHPAATHRLNIGVPATVEHASHSSGPGQSSDRERAKRVAETTQAFITFMDALKLKLRAKDQLHPLLSEVMGTYVRSVDAGSAAEEGRAKILHWLIALNQMKASDDVNEDQARQMLFDIEAAYNSWFRSLQDS